MSTALDELFEPYPAHLSVNNLATVLGVTLKTAYEYLQNNQIPCYRIGTRWMILRDEVKEFIRTSARQPLVDSAEPPSASRAPDRASQVTRPVAMDPETAGGVWATI